MPRGLLVAAALLLCLAGGVWWAEKHPKTDETKKTEDAPKILTIPDGQITEIKLTRGSDVVALAKLADKWEIVQPKPMPADNDAVAGITGALSSLTADRLIEDKPASLAQFGLDTPVSQVEIKRKDGKTDVLLFGANTVTLGNTYVKLAAAPAVYTIPSATKSSFDKTLNDLRDKRVIAFNPEKVTTVSLAPAKGGPVEFAKNGQNEWQIVKPKTYRADNLQVDDLVRKLKDAKLDFTTPDEDAAKAFAKAAKLASITVTDSAGTQTVEVRKAEDKTVYAKSSSTEGIHKVTGDLGDGLDKAAEDYRNKKLFDFGFSDPQRLDLGGTVYERNLEKWSSGGKQLDPQSMQAVVDKLRDFAATKFADKPEGSSVLAVAVTYGEQKRTEKVAVSKSGDTYYAQRDGEPGVYVVESKTYEELQKAIAGIKPAAPASKQAEKKK